MKLQLMLLRKRAGFKSRRALADKLGVKERTIKAWELGESQMSLVTACQIADVLDCSLDELAGRFEYTETHSDPRFESLTEDYRAMDETGKIAAVGAVKGLRHSGKFSPKA